MKKLKENDSTFLANFENKVQLTKDMDITYMIIHFLLIVMCPNKNFNKLVKHFKNSNKILYNLYKLIIYFNTRNMCMYRYRVLRFDNTPFLDPSL